MCIYAVQCFYTTVSEDGHMVGQATFDAHIALVLGMS